MSKIYKRKKKINEQNLIYMAISIIHPNPNDIMNEEFNANVNDDFYIILSRFG